jgi:hypothetical protein
MAYICDLDMNSQYSTAMLENLPYSDFSMERRQDIGGSRIFCKIRNITNGWWRRTWETPVCVGIRCDDKDWQDKQIEYLIVLESKVVVTLKQQSPYNQQLVENRKLNKEHS